MAFQPGTRLTKTYKRINWTDVIPVNSPNLNNLDNYIDVLEDKLIVVSNNVNLLLDSFKDTVNEAAPSTTMVVFEKGMVDWIKSRIIDGGTF